MDAYTQGVGTDIKNGTHDFLENPTTGFTARATRATVAVVVYGGKTSTVGTVILNYYAVANYPFAAVNAIMLMLAMMVGVVIILRLIDIRKEL